MRISSIKTLTLAAVTIWTIGIINWLNHYQLNQYGIFPREPTALIGIITSQLPTLAQQYRELSYSWMVSVVIQQKWPQPAGQAHPICCFLGRLAHLVTSPTIISRRA